MKPKITIPILAITAVILYLLVVFVFPGKIVLPQAFSLGSVTIHYYGLILALAVLSAYALARSRRALFNLPEKQVENIFFVVLISGFIGARLYHILSSLNYYMQNPSEMAAVWNGGLSIFGAIIGGLVSLFAYKKYFIGQVSYWTLLDWLVPSVMLGQIIGRFGNLFNYEAYGWPTNLPWKMFVPESFRLAGFEGVSFFHPLFLYESIAGLLILWILLKYSEISKRFGLFRPKGAVFGTWLFLYGSVRFFTEILRLDSGYIIGIKFNLIVAVLMVISGLILALRTYFYESYTTQDN